MLLKTDSWADEVDVVNAAGEDAEVEIDAAIASSVDDDWVNGTRSVVVDGKAVLEVVGIGVDDVVAAMVVLVINFFSLRTIIESAKFVGAGVELVEVDDDWVDDSVM